MHPLILNFENFYINDKIIKLEKFLFADLKIRKVLTLFVILNKKMYM